MSPRLPFLLIASIAGGGLLAASAEGLRPRLAGAPRPEAGVAAPVAPAEDALASTWYCAGGTADDGGLADHEVVVANPTDREVSGRMTVFPGLVDDDPTADGDGAGVPGGVDAADGADADARGAAAGPAGAAELSGALGRRVSGPRERAFTVPAGSLRTFRLADLQPGPLASALVELDGGGVAVEHRITGPHGRDLAPCASSAASTWHFAWGSTARDARELLVLFNPFPSEVTVDATFVTATGRREPLRWQGLVVPARATVGVDVGRDVTRRDHVAATVRARGGGRLVVDRVQVLDGTARTSGLSLALGQPAPAEVAVFPHGRTDDHVTEQIVVYNPGREPAEVEVAVQGTGVDARRPHPFGLVVRPGRFEVVDYGNEDRVPRGSDHATVVRSRNGVPVVAERVLAGRTELTASPGALLAATVWTVPVVDGGGEDATSLAVVNPDPDRPTRLSLELYADGARARPVGLQQIRIPAGGRISVSVPVDAGLPGPATAVVRAEDPLGVERVIVRGDTTVTAGAGIPSAERVEPLL